ncbi:MAG: PfkB family carbohydrate kinase [Thermoanaerobaculia bacterium]|nr:PfkB family carbohydrate kinase [Thermoanaerobaculia bacterium]
MSITVVGSVAFDAIQTPFGSVEKAIGGAATYFSVAASFFTPVSVVGVVGDDFGAEEMKIFAGRTIDTSGIERVPGAKTFFWRGEYGYDLNVAQTKDTQLNVFADFKPKLGAVHRDPNVLFLANIDPDLQYEVLQQAGRPKLVALDTMNYWIDSKKASLEKVMRSIDLMLINEAEVRQFSGEANLIKGARAILDIGIDTLVVKRGEYGVLMFHDDRIFAAPAYPLESVFDPTGAGDTFAGGFLGYLASRKHLTEVEMRRAIVFGSVVASYNVEAFSLDRLRAISRDDIESRYREFRALTHFEDFELEA